MHTDSSVLVTGGTGSFGRTVTRQLLELDCREVRVFSRDETKQDEMRRSFGHDPRLKFYIGDVRDRESVDHAMRGVNSVFHAAALKQVPSCEFFPIQAVQTNVLGSHNVIESAIAHGADRVICLSTDKAVYPINTMGMTKALMEKVARAATRHVPPGGPVIACVRYGNVMFSRGSVLPLFVRQIREGGPVTVTDPEMTRFLLPLRDSVTLVEHAFRHARPGDVFVRKAAACTLGTLVEALQALFESEVDVRVIGIRHGEKSHETLASAEELRHAEDMGQFLRLPLDERDLNYEAYFEEGEVVPSSISAYDSSSARRLTVEETAAVLRELPEIQGQLDRAGVAKAAS